MNILYRFFSWVLFGSMISSMLIVIIILLRKILKSKINPNLLNALWIIVLIRLLLPINIDSQYSVYSLLSKNINTNEKTEVAEEGNIRKNIGDVGIALTQLEILGRICPRGIQLSR